MLAFIPASVVYAQAKGAMQNWGDYPRTHVYTTSETSSDKGQLYLSTIGPTMGYTLAISAVLRTQTSFVNSMDPTRPPFNGGLDIGAWINAAAASCVANTPCVIEVPPDANYSFATSITTVSDETISCAGSRPYLDNSGALSGPSQLNYTGTRSLLVMPRTASRVSIVGCSFNLANASAAIGLELHGIGFWFRNSTISGGGSGTTLIRAGGISSRNYAGDYHFVSSFASNFVGTLMKTDYVDGIYTDHFITAGVKAGTKALGFVFDTETQGVYLTTSSIQDGGLHGLVIQRTESGSFPENFFLNNFQVDNALGGDGWLFDSSLAAAPLAFTASNSWSSGSGGAAVHISGGGDIAIVAGSRLSSSAGDGVLIDGVGGGIQIVGDEIIGNNRSNTAGGSGVRVTSHLSNLVITDNLINNGTAAGSYQAYAFYSTSDIDNVNFSHNGCGTNLISCMNATAIAKGKLTAIGNTSEKEPFLPNLFPAYASFNQLGVGEATIMPYSGNGMAGVGMNFHFDGTNYSTLTDGTNNGAFGFLANYGSGQGCVISIPTASPSKGQSFSPSNMVNSNCRLAVSPTQINTFVPLAGPATAPNGSCTIVGWVFSQDGHATFCNGTIWVTKI